MCHSDTMHLRNRTGHQRAPCPLPALPPVTQGPGGNPHFFSLSLQEDRQSLTWVDVLEKRLPDGVLQGARVLGGWEVFICQVGLMDLPLEPGRAVGEKASWGQVPTSRARS